MPDWDVIKTEYITTETTYRRLCAKYGVSLDTLQDRARRERWVDLRKKHREKVVNRAARKVATDQSNRLASLQVSADKMAGVIGKVLADAEQFNRHIVTEGQGGGVTQASCRTMAKADTKGIRDLTAAIKDLSAVMRNLYGIPTDGENEARDLARRRLALDEKRAGDGRPEDGETGVLVLAAVEDGGEAQEAQEEE